MDERDLVSRMQRGEQRAFDEFFGAYAPRLNSFVVRRAEVFSGPGLGLYGLTVTFAAIDWIMSLEPEWYSTIFGALIGTSQVLAALA